MTVDVCLFPGITMMKMWGFLHVQTFPSGFSVLGFRCWRAPRSNGQLFSLASWYKSTISLHQPINTSSRTKWLCIPCFDALKFNRSCFFVSIFVFFFSPLPFSLTGQFRKGSPVRVFRWWWEPVSARFLLPGKCTLRSERVSYTWVSGSRKRAS